MKNFFLVVTGPTGVGKTQWIEDLYKHMSKIHEKIAIINADLGQMYAPLSIGTAKPDYQDTPYKQYLFDLLDTPEHFSVTQYRERVIDCLKSLWSSGIVPVLVGGSGFYLKSLFFPPQELEKNSQNVTSDEVDHDQLWQKLYAIDPERATHLAKQDHYRLKRALDLYESSGVLPSKLKPVFDPPGRFLVVLLTRDKEELYRRINQRVEAMMAAGWIAEVRLLDASWKQFLSQKKLIGYPEIIAALQSDEVDWDLVQQRISTATRNYAKRQVTFFKSFKKDLERSDPQHTLYLDWQECDLTFPDLGVYLEQLVTLIKRAKEET